MQLPPVVSLTISIQTQVPAVKFTGAWVARNLTRLMKSGGEKLIWTFESGNSALSTTDNVAPDWLNGPPRTTLSGRVMVPTPGMAERMVWLP